MEDTGDAQAVMGKGRWLTINRLAFAPRLQRSGFISDGSHRSSTFPARAAGICRAVPITRRMRFACTGPGAGSGSPSHACRAVTPSAPMALTRYRRPCPIGGSPSGAMATGRGPNAGPARITPAMVALAARGRTQKNQVPRDRTGDSRAPCITLFSPPSPARPI